MKTIKGPAGEDLHDGATFERLLDAVGDGEVDFGAIFSKLAACDYPGWAVLGWECALKHPEDGAQEGAPFIRDHIIRVTPHAFDDFAASGVDAARNRALLGIG